MTDPSPKTTQQAGVIVVTSGGANYLITSPPVDTVFANVAVTVKAKAPTRANMNDYCIKADGVHDLQNGQPAEHFELAFVTPTSATDLGGGFSEYSFSVLLNRTGMNANADDAVLHLCLSMGGKWRVMRSLDIVLG